MRSPRSRFESACRVGAFALLGWLLGTTVIPSRGRRSERASSSGVAARLPEWTRASSTVVLHGDFATTPSAATIEWLAALAHSGHVVTWSGSPPAVAIDAEALPDPSGATRIDVAAPAESRVIVRDDASVIDSVHVTTMGARVFAPVVVGAIAAASGGQHFGVGAPDSVRTRAIVVIGGAAWEGKFIVSALEERGWPVIARFSVAPGVNVAQGGPLVFDTSRVAAVIAVDTTIAAFAAEVTRFVRAGGGLVLAGPSSLASSVAGLVPGALGTRLRPTVEPKDTIGLGSTGFYPVTLGRDGVAIERRPNGIAIAARRLGAGRVVQVGYDDSWRWRMAGAAGSEAAHREWWSRVVSSVAYVPAAAPTSAPVSHSLDESAPLARMIDRIGPSRPLPTSDAGRRPIDRRILMTLIMILLLTEWGSRRLRGFR
jgi:hypothetical protein